MILSLEDRLLNSWVKLSGLIKNNRITKGLCIMKLQLCCFYITAMLKMV